MARGGLSSGKWTLGNERRNVSNRRWTLGGRKWSEAGTINVKRWTNLSDKTTKTWRKTFCEAGRNDYPHRFFQPIYRIMTRRDQQIPWPSTSPSSPPDRGCWAQRQSAGEQTAAAEVRFRDTYQTTWSPGGPSWYRCEAMSATGQCQLHIHI